MTKDNTKTELEATAKKMVELEQMLSKVVAINDRLETKLDTLLSYGNPSHASGRSQAGSTSEPVSEEDDTEWLRDLDGITRFNLEQGWTTKEEVRKGMKEG
jgi:hypothetical protein